MTITEFDKYKNYIKKTDLANVFNVYIDKNGNTLYNLNMSVVLENQTSNNIFKYYYPTGDNTALSIAYTLYNDITLYWIILKLNNITDSFHIFKANSAVKYLDTEIVRAIVNNL